MEEPTRADWSLTEAAVVEADEPTPDDDDPEFEVPLVRRLMQAIAAQSGGRLVEVAPGRWYESKIGSAPPASI